MKQRVLIAVLALASASVAFAQPAARQLVVGQEASGELAEGDARLVSGEYSDAWTLSVRRGQRFIVTLRSTEFDPYLLVRGPGGLSEDNDDDPAGGSLDSRLDLVAPADGVVQIGATSYAPGESGRYVIAAHSDEAGEGPRPVIAQAPRPRASAQSMPAAPSTPSPATLELGRSVAGVLLPTDRQRSSGKYEDVYQFVGRRGQAIDLRLSSDDFDPYLLVSGPDGFSAYNDDENGQTLASRLALRLPADGVYRVSATSYRAGALGAYRISAAPAPATASFFSAEPGQPLQLGGSVRGALSPQDERIGGKAVDRYSFIGRRGQRVSLALSSGEFDTYLTLTQPDGLRLENDDSTTPDGESSLNSRIETVLPEDGTYGVLVSSYAQGASGAYELSLSPSNGTPRQARVQGGQRVFALMVGVSDYGGRTSDLPSTDEDATRLYESLREAGLLHPASIVLTNAEATRPAVEAAFERVARQAGPDDLFLFFFSGHGDQIPAARDAGEIDGLTETIELRDGPMTDRELGRLFQRVRARMALLVVDSCFSGGFEELVDRPNIMAMFSSEEDLTSEVASRLGAGGYLSHFVRTGLSGEGDIDGDGMITAGEIATYVRRQFRAQGEIGAETVDRLQRNQQNLVIRRGGVQVDDVVVRLRPVTVASAP